MDATHTETKVLLLYIEFIISEVPKNSEAWMQKVLLESKIKNTE